MDTEQFDRLVEAAVAQKPGWFSELEAPATVDDVAQVEEALGVPLPEGYRHFATTFGAGYFGKINISSLKRGSEWFRADSLIQLPDSRMFYVLSDDQTGGFYGFAVGSDHCDEAVGYVHPDDGSVMESVAGSFFDFVAENGLP